MFFTGNQNLINDFEEFGNLAITTAQTAVQTKKLAAKKKTVVRRNSSNPAVQAAMQANKLAANKKKVVLGISAAGTVGGNYVAGSTIDASVVNEVPKNSGCQYVSTFISKIGALTMISVLGLGYQGYKRGSLALSEQSVKRKFEEKFNNVRVTSSPRSGAIEVNFVTRGNWSKNGLRDECDKLMKTATGYGVQTSFLEVTKIGNVSTGQTVNNSPTQQQGQLNDLASNVTDTAIQSVGDGVSGFISNLGITTPIAVLIGGIALIVVLKK